MLLFKYLYLHLDSNNITTVYICALVTGIVVSMEETIDSLRRYFDNKKLKIMKFLYLQVLVMSPLYIWGLLVGLVVSVAETTDLTTLCGQILSRPASYRIQLMCDELTTFLHKLQRENGEG